MAPKREFGVYFVGAVWKGWELGGNDEPLKFHEHEARMYAHRKNQTARNGSYVAQRLEEES